MSNPASSLADRRPPKVWTSVEETDPHDLEANGAAELQYEVINEVDTVPEGHRSSCWHGFMSGIGGCWRTREMATTEDKEWHVRTTLRELVIYIFFVVVLCILTFGMMSPTMYYHTKVISELFLDSSYNDTLNNVRGSTQVIDFWRFVDNVMLDSLYWENWYNNDAVGKQDRNVLYENRLLGSPRLRQLRVRNDSCKVHDEFISTIFACYDNYAPDIEDKRPFGLMNGTAWQYFSEKQLNGSSHWGRLASYSGAGSYIDLGTSKDSAKHIMNELRQNLWISRATRAVFLDFTVYNANINLFCIAKIVFEFPATGGMIPSWSFRTVKLLRYVNPFDYFIMGCEILFSVFIMYYIIEEAIEIKKNKCNYFKSIWNVLDIVVIVLSLVCIAFSIYRILMVDTMLEGLLNKPDEFADFEFLGFWQTQFNNAVALAVFFAWIKIFKYISFNKTMTQLSSTLSRCSKDITGFAVMFFIVFVAYSQLGYLLFGSQVQDFSSFLKAIFTLLRVILGDFNFNEIEEANRVLGPLYFLSYVFFVFFVLMNMFLAIINDTYAEVKTELANEKNEFEIGEYFKKSYKNLMSKLGRRDKIVDIQNAMKQVNGDQIRKFSFDEIRQTLKQQNFTDVEIEMIFSKYDLDGNRVLDEIEMKQMLLDLEGQKSMLEKEIQNDKQEAENSGGTRPSNATVGGGGVAPDEFNVLSRRVDRMEHSIGSIVSKIDAVLVKMNAMERAKAKRRENVNKILDTISETEGLDERAKRQQMEKLVREELQRWDSEASMNIPEPSARGGSE
ncbi:polycystin-2-like [Limulus polyphemus]|uniref:Polycystin-2-like n=1 Tax=Limulus polyphemus TaxID=6850 RepID=A0ABM1BBU0_LIMPO|nr:polycystin-2-like [Limulus polyphemus]